MSNGDYEFLGGYTDGERWVWLAGTLEGMGNRMSATEDVQEANCEELDALKACCASRGWIVWALKFVIATAVLQILAVAGWALAQVFAG